MTTQFRAEGLSPYVDYDINIRAANEFTEFEPGSTGFGSGPTTPNSRIRTLEGGVCVCVCVCACVRVGSVACLKNLHYY